MIELTVSFPNWGTALVVIVGAVFINAAALIGAYTIGRTGKEGENDD